MAQNYTRQSTLSDGDTITASLFNDEYNQLVNAFTYSSTSASSTGHRHDGSAGQGGNIFKIGDLDFLNKIEVDSTNNRLGFYVEVSSAAVEQIRIQDGSVVPVTTNDIDLGTSSLQFKDLYIDGTANVDSLTLTSGSTVTTILDEDDLSSDSATALVTQQSVKAYVDAQVTAQDFDFQADSGGALSIDLDSETMTFTGGTGIDTSGSGNAVTFDIDSTVATLTGTQTLTNKTLTTPTISGNLTTDGTIDGRDIATDGAKLDGIEAGATADQTAAEIRTLVESATDSNVFTDADHSKLDGIEASADVTDTANVTAAGALMDSEVTNLAQVKAFDSSDYATAAQGSTADSALQNVVEDTTPQLGGDLASNGNDILFADNDKAVFGAGSDLQIYHDASHSFIKDSGTGHLKIQATNLKLQDVDGNNYIDCIDGSYVRLMHNTATKLETTSTGIDVTGVITTDGMTTSADINFGDNDKAIFGAGSDLEIYHDGSNSFIADVGTGNLGIRAENLFLQNADGSANYATASLNGAFTLSYNNSIKLATTSTGIDVIGTVTADGLTVDGTAQFNTGAAGIAEFYHTSGYGGIKTTGSASGSGAVIYLSNDKAGTPFDIYTIFADGSDDSLQFWSGGNPSSGTKRFNAASNGDISFYEDTGTTAKLFWDASLESLGIGTTSLTPTDGANIELSSSTSSRFLLDNTGASGRKYAITSDTSGNLGFYDYDASAFRILVDSSGNVGIGTSSPTSDISVGSTTTSSGDIALRTTKTAAVIAPSNTAAGGLDIGVGWVSGGQGPLTFSLTGAEKMRIDSSGNVGIGTSSPSGLLNVHSASGDANVFITTGTTNASTTLLFGDSGSSTIGRVQYDHSDNSMRFQTNASEAMRIDSSGNLLVGKTSSDLTTDGFEVRPTGFVGVRTNGDPLYLNRKSTDGAIATFAKDGTTVGSIQSRAGLVSTIILDPRSGSLGTGITGSGANLSPTNGSGTEVDARNDIGTSTYRFKDLHLSGTAYVATSIGIGTSSPATKLEVTGTGDAETGVTTTHTRSGVGYTLILDNLTNAASNGSGVKWRSGGFDTGAIITRSDSTAASNDAPAFMTFHTSDDGTENLAERMRIDSSGNLLVGTTDSAPAVSNSEVGVALSGSLGYVAASRSAGASGFFNRLSDGDIVNFNKDGTTVGSIGTAGGDLTINGQGGIGVLQAGGTGQFAWASNLFYPITDNAKDLGTSSFRFKDLYLSGGVQFGTTGAAAQNLDDYEEGTWTPVLVGSTTAGTATFVTGPTGTYTKIGNQVTVYFDWNISAHTGTGALRITGLPFALGSGVGVGAIMDGNYTYSAGRTKLVPYVVSSSILRIYQTGDGLGYTENVLDTSHQINGSVTYQTA